MIGIVRFDFFTIVPFVGYGCIGTFGIAICAFARGIAHDGVRFTADFLVAACTDIPMLIFIILCDVCAMVDSGRKNFSATFTRIGGGATESMAFFERNGVETVDTGDPMVVFIVFEGRIVVVLDIVAGVFRATITAYARLSAGGNVGFDICFCAASLAFFPMADIVMAYYYIIMNSVLYIWKPTFFTNARIVTIGVVDIHIDRLTTGFTDQPMLVFVKFPFRTSRVWMINVLRRCFYAANGAHCWIVAVNLVWLLVKSFTAIDAFIPVVFVVRIVCMTSIVPNVIASV